MTRDEGLEVLRVFTAAWPARQLTDDAAELWLVTLEPLDAQHAATTVLALVNESRFFPVPAEFRERYAQVVRRAELERPRAIEAPAPPPEEQLEHLAEARKALHGD